MGRVIELRTEIPGPASRAILERRAKAVPRGVPAVTPLVIARAEGAVLTDVDGNRLIDFAGGIGVLNVGHRHPAVLDALRTQLDEFLHLCFAVSSYEPYVRLAERLNAITPGTFDKRTVLVNSGAEAVENAIKIARIATGRPAVVCYEHAFHGRTNLTMALTSKVMPYKRGFGPFAPEVYRIPFPYCYRCPEASSGSRCCMADRQRLEQTFAVTVDPESVAAIIIELELGEGGFVPAPREYIAALSDFARSHGILLIADEIQTGFARTGKMFACEHYDLEPDLIVTAKSLAGGLPLAAVTGRADVMEASHPGGLGGTYGGNPLACAAALAVIDAMAREELPARAQRLGSLMRERLRCLAEQDQGIGDVRGLGAMVAIELVTDRATRAPDKARTTRVLSEALQRGLLLLSAGTLGNVVRILAPVSIADDVAEEGLAVLAQALAASRG
jgi:4-aminobutyrate aminotransferase/(S)-3-amino-2-methylpropionate transaminase